MQTGSLCSSKGENLQPCRRSASTYVEFNQDMAMSERRGGYLGTYLRSFFPHPEEESEPDLLVRASARGRLGSCRSLSSIGLPGQFLCLATTIETRFWSFREALVFIEALLSSSPDKFRVAVSADAIDVFELCISFFNSFLLGFIDLGFRLVFPTRRLHRFWIQSKHLESKSFLSRIRLSRDWDSQSTDDRDVVVSIGAEVRESFQEILPVLVDFCRVLHEMPKSRRPLPHESRVGSLALDLFDSRLGETIDEMSDAADVRQELLRRENSERDFRDGVEDGLDSVLSNSRTQLIEPFGFPVLDPLPVGFAVLLVFEIQASEFLGEFENHVLALLESMFD